MNPKDKTRYIPIGVAAKKSRLERFAALNRWVTARGGWLVSPPGTNPAILEVLPGSYLLDELREAGYEPMPAGEGERIIPGQIVQRFTMTSDGAFEPLAAESTRSVALTTMHAGITRVLRYAVPLVEVTATPA
ncbi:hypothetical protein [Bradyrhizobium sp. SZCCHNS3004]|uniref:hypothetical protein n=1 Tax=Bradyrhizobium sp. SZCCHNS3004 TaxID=3057312 RepID=UPI002916D52A|nr:hypothetical protein [Bradyrhizobium sp. SZCCHNS3004]